MISQVLNREFVRQALEQVEEYLSTPPGQRRRGAPLHPDAQDLVQDDYDEALVHVRQAIAREVAGSSGQPGYESPRAERRGERAASIDDFSFFSRDPAVGNLQSALEVYFTEGPDSRPAAERVITAPRPAVGRRDAPSLPAITDVRLPGSEAPRDTSGRRILDKFSVTDIGWVSSLVAMGVRLFRKRHAFVDTPPPPIRIDSKARIIVVGDWGSGIPRAQRVAQQMRAVLDEGNGNREQHVIHLGDVYYSGWQREYEKRFLPYWPVRLDEVQRIGSFCLNGNHDMYSGGFGYYDYLLKDARFQRHYGCSYFGLYNDDWNILGLDTAWDDNGLRDPQKDWAAARIAEVPNRKNILMSHHQPFSSFEAAGDVIPRKLSALLDVSKIHTWFWGHEHRCAVYEPNDQFHVKCGRLVGHGGVPVYVNTEPQPANVEYELRDYIDEGLEHWTLFGFAVLDFDGPRINVRYIDENGREGYSETLE